MILGITGFGLKKLIVKGGPRSTQNKIGTPP